MAGNQMPVRRAVQVTVYETACDVSGETLSLSSINLISVGSITVRSYNGVNSARS